MSGELDRNLSLLLGRAWAPPEIRPAFRDDLLARLKAEQRKLIARRQSRRKTILFSASLLAAAAAVAFAVAPAVGLPVPDPGPASARQVSTRQVSEVAAVQGAGVLRFVPDIGSDRVELRAADGGWAAAAEAQFDLPAGAELRAGAAPARLAFGEAQIALQPGTRISNDAGSLRLAGGGALVMTAAAPVDLRIESRAFRIEPRSEIFFKAADPEGFAAGGAPAPLALVTRGAAELAGAFPARLAAGYVFTLYETPSGAVPGRCLREADRAIAARSSALPDGVVPVSAAAGEEERRQEVIALGSRLLSAEGAGWIEIGVDASAAAPVAAGSSEFDRLAALEPDLRRLVSLGGPIALRIGGRTVRID